MNDERIHKEAQRTQRMLLEGLTREVIGCAIEVHKHLGPGLLESTYSACLMHELVNHGLKASNEVCLPITYKGLTLKNSYRLDVIVEDKLILELKSAESLLPIHEAQLITYLKISKLRVGLLINFNSTVLHKNIKRLML